VEAGKKAASAILSVRKSVIEQLKENKGSAQSASQIAEQIGKPDKLTWIFKILENLAINQPNLFKRIKGENPLEDLFLTI
jgi:hypothetical protein